MSKAMVACAVFGAALCLSFETAVGEELGLKVRPGVGDVAVSWPAQLRVPVSGVQVSGGEIQRSSDLKNWETLYTIPAGTSSAGWREMHFPRSGKAQYYRIRGQLSVSASMPDGVETFGYAEEMDRQLNQIGQITPEEFRNLFPPPQYLDRISWDPTTAKYWTNLNAPPKTVYTGNAKVIADTKLNEVETAILSTNGFVVSERLGGHSFADVYYKVFTRDLPVFVTSDSILQAWHRSVEGVQGEIEEVYMLPNVSNVVASMQRELPGVWAANKNGPLAQSILDADYFLTVALSLLQGTNVQAATTISPSSPVATTLSAIKAGVLQNFVVYDRTHGAAPPQVDFSQFKVRGYYTKTDELRRYFRGMMWLGVMDFRIAGNPDDPSPRELGSLIVLCDLLKRAGMLETWQNSDRFLRSFVGTPDSMDFGQAIALLKSAGISSCEDVTSSQRLNQLQDKILSGQLGLQSIQGAPFYAPFGPEQLNLPRSFAVFGQRFVFDSWALTQATYDRILRVESGQTNKVMRRIPSGLDVGFSVLGNNAAVPELIFRMNNTAGTRFRDGLPYQHNLAAVRNIIDCQQSEAWNATMYSMWLAALRTLSEPTTGVEYPEAMRTRGWGEKTLTTQLASWTHLRHNNVLYAKESFTPDILCDYPTGFVEPRVPFWNGMRELALKTADCINALPFSGTAMVRAGVNYSNTVQLADLKQTERNFFINFANVSDKLGVISTKELQQQPLDTSELAFLKSVVENSGFMYFGIRTFSGWYPGMFYHPVRHDEVLAPALDKCDEWAPVIVDVHTDQPAPLVQDPGAILHEAVGNVHLIVIAVDNGPDRTIYAGPALSYYEMLYPINQRKTDSDWKSVILTKSLPAAPEWTRGYLAPGPIDIPSWAR